MPTAYGSKLTYTFTTVPSTTEVKQGDIYGSSLLINREGVSDEGAALIELFESIRKAGDRPIWIWVEVIQSDRFIYRYKAEYQAERLTTGTPIALVIGAVVILLKALLVIFAVIVVAHLIYMVATGKGEEIVEGVAEAATAVGVAAGGIGLLILAIVAFNMFGSERRRV